VEQRRRELEHDISIWRDPLSCAWIVPPTAPDNSEIRSPAPLPAGGLPAPPSPGPASLLAADRISPFRSRADRSRQSRARSERVTTLASDDLRERILLTERPAGAMLPGSIWAASPAFPRVSSLWASVLFDEMRFCG
jgi:hypothetical protein